MGLGGASLIVPLYVVELGGGPVTLGVLAAVAAVAGAPGTLSSVASGVGGVGGSIAAKGYRDAFLVAGGFVLVGTGLVGVLRRRTGRSSNAGGRAAGSTGEGG